MSDMTTESVGAFHPSKPLFRFTILAFVAFLPFGSYFAYDVIGAIAPTLQEQFGARGMIGASYTMYSVAAILTVLIGGILIDRLGTRKASLSFSLLVLTGQVVVWLAGSIPVFFADDSSSELVLNHSSWPRAPSWPAGSRGRSWPWPLAFR